MVTMVGNDSTTMKLFVAYHGEIEGQVGYERELRLIVFDDKSSRVAVLSSWKKVLTTWEEHSEDK